MANQHMRYLPKKRLMFNHLSADGPMALLFEGKDGSSVARKQHLWKYLSAVTIPIYSAI